MLKRKILICTKELSRVEDLDSTRLTKVKECDEVMQEETFDLDNFVKYLQKKTHVSSHCMSRISSYFISKGFSSVRKSIIQEEKEKYKTSLKSLQENKGGKREDDAIDEEMEKDIFLIRELLTQCELYDISPIGKTIKDLAIQCRRLDNRHRLDNPEQPEVRQRERFNNPDYITPFLASFIMGFCICTTVLAVSTCYAKQGQEGMFDCLTSGASAQIGNAAESVYNWYAGMVGGGK